MNFGEAISSVLSKYSTFSGRAARSEYWYWTLFQWLLLFGLMLASLLMAARSGTSPMILMVVFAIAFIVMILPTISVAVRRLHDMDYAAWWVLIGIIPYVGGIALFVWFLLPGTIGGNRFGPDPLGDFDEGGGGPATHHSSIPSVRRDD